MSNVVHLPRPQALRPTPARLGHYLRVGHNDHREIAHLLAEGERAFQGLVIDARAVTRHRELIAQSGRLGLDIILDTKAQAAAFVGGYKDSLGQLPWGLGRQANLADYTGAEGMRRADEVAAFALRSDCSAVIAPTHLLTGPNDPWFHADRLVAGRLRSTLPRPTALIYSLALPMQVLREPEVRSAIIEGLRGLDIDALWLKIENFGADASGDKVRTYIEACADFHQLGVALVADHVGGLPGLGLLAFSAVGGIAHGVMMLESFKASSWRRPVGGNGRTPAPRVYLQALDLLLPPVSARALIDHSSRVKAQHACRDPRCCPRGYRDMVEQPTRHYLYSRAREVESLGAVPATARPAHFLERSVRPRSDALAATATLALGDERLAATLQDRNRSVGRLRGAFASLAEGFAPATTALAPLSRAQREDG